MTSIIFFAGFFGDIMKLIDYAVLYSKGSVCMKKVILVLTAALMMVFSGVCLASDGGDLNKQQSVSQLVLDSFGENVPEYKKVTADFEDSLKSNMDEKTYRSLQRQVKEQYGKITQVKFYAFERFDARDRVTYLASFDSGKIASIVFSFDKSNKLVEFGIFPQQAAEDTAAQPNEQK